jgi:16S rRNA (guanine527-N7)-methyltransferase
LNDRSNRHALRRKASAASHALTPDPQDRPAALRLTPVSRETESRLDAFVDLLLTWQAKINLIAPSTIARLWTRHIADSLQLLPLAPEDARSWIDFGSGGGFPGVVLACALAERPGASVRLIESNGRKAAFLGDVIRTLKLPAIVHCKRIEDFIASEPDAPDVITARALAPLDRLAGFIHPLLQEKAIALLLKGQDVEDELTEASKCWNIKADFVPSRTSQHGRVLIVRALGPRG